MNQEYRFAYLPQFDSLRCYAILGVLVSHFLPHDDAIRNLLPWGTLGVELFFALSGYLISGILLTARESISEGQERYLVLRNFYARRILRLFPLYYAYLLAALLFLPSSREHIVAFFLYMQNFLFAERPDVYEKVMAHFWTLAVEEQFYLTWPFLLLFVPRERVLAAILSVVAIGPLFRALGLASGYSAFQVGLMMPAHCDTFALGGLLAALAVYKPALSKRFGAACFWAGTPLLVCMLVLNKIGTMGNLALLIGPLATGLFFTAVLWHVRDAAGSPLRRILLLPATVYLGRISYGIYVIHFNVPGLLREIIFPRIGLSLSSAPWVNFALFFLVSVALAAISWHFMEKPINDLKARIPYYK